MNMKRLSRRESRVLSAGQPVVAQGAERTSAALSARINSAWDTPIWTIFLAFAFSCGSVFAVPIPPNTPIEEHVIQQSVSPDEVNWGGEYSTSIVIPKFDTMGGARELLDMRFTMKFSWSRTIHWDDASTISVPTQAQVTTKEVVWIEPFMTVLGVPPDGGFVQGNGGCRPPFDPARVIDGSNYWATGYGYDDDSELVPMFNLAVSVEDPAELVAFIGAGDVSLPARWSALEPIYGEQVQPPCPSGAIYTPGALHAELDGLSVVLVVYYAYRPGDPIFANGFDTN